MFLQRFKRKLTLSARVGVMIAAVAAGLTAFGVAVDMVIAVGEERARLERAAARAHGIGLRVNAGHGLTVGNVGPILELPHLDTLNIGHSIVCRAVAVGLVQATREMLERIGGGNREDA